MKVPNGFFGSGPGKGEDPVMQRERDEYNRNRVQMTVATSTFAGIAVVGLFCSCLWFVCCRNSSSKTRKKGRTWAAANDTALQHNPYSYDGYLESQGYLQTAAGGDQGVAPYLGNPLYHPNSLPGDLSDGGLTSAYDFNRGGVQNGGAGSKAQFSTLFGGPPLESGSGNPKDTPPSYTALFFAASEGNSGTQDTKNAASSGGVGVTNIKPIHLKVTSTSANAQHRQKPEEADNDAKAPKKNVTFAKDGDDEDDEEECYLRKDPSEMPPVSLLSVESDDLNDNDKAEVSDKKETRKEDTNKNDDSVTKMTNAGDDKDQHDRPPPPYNPGYNTYTNRNQGYGYARF